MSEFRVNLTEEAFYQVKKAAAAHDLPPKQYMSHLVEQIGLDEQGIKIILTVPEALLQDNRGMLQHWLAQRLRQILETYYPGETC